MLCACSRADFRQKLSSDSEDLPERQSLTGEFIKLPRKILEGAPCRGQGGSQASLRHGLWKIRQHERLPAFVYRTAFIGIPPSYPEGPALMGV